MFNKVSGRKRGGGGGGGEHQGSCQAKVGMLEIWNDGPIIEWTKEQATVKEKVEYMFVRLPSH